MSSGQIVVAATATVVAMVAACRSTWSPCGQSMLSTITPLGERARGNRYGTTATWFVVGALAGGVTLGGVMAGLAAAMAGAGAGPIALEVAGSVALALAAASDLGVRGWRLPYHRRQVNERWLDQFRPWVYGAGFGWQIGTGLTTYVMTAAVYAVIVLGALTAQPLVALLIGSLFGLIRGLGVLLGRHIVDPGALLRFHRWFDRIGPRVRLGTIAVEAGASVVLAGFAWLPAALVATGAALALGAAVATGHGDAGRVSLAAPTPEPPLTDR